jgi:DNA-binding CsgD family transcriptional regulator
MNFLPAISHISTTLLRSNNDTFENDLSNSMAIMSEIAKVDRVYIWENHTKLASLHASQLYEWSHAEPQQNKSLVNNVSYKSSMPNWLETLSVGKCVTGLVSKFPSSTKEILFAQNIVSILVVPIFIHKQFWGFIGFDDCYKERVFSENEEIILRFGSELLANALIRNNMEKNIRYLETSLQKHLPLTDHLKQIKTFDKLAGQEIRLAELIVQGYNNSEIMKILDITGNTVKGYRKSLYSKLQIHSRRELFELLEKSK